MASVQECQQKMAKSFCRVDAEKVASDSPHKFRPKHRLADPKVIAKLRSGHKKSNGAFLMCYRSNKMDYGRIAIVVSKSRLKHAVDRNKIKRIVRESFRHCQNLVKGYDCLIIFKRDTSSLNDLLLRLNIDTLWQQLTG